MMNCVGAVGMTDKQFSSYVRKIKMKIDEIIEVITDDNDEVLKDLKSLSEELQKDIEN